MEPVTRGDPESPLRWTCKSLRKLAEELQRKGHRTSHQLVGRMLHDLGYSLQANSKTLEGTNHPDRNAQFEYLNRRVKRQLQQHQPVISVDTKKKELVGDFKNNGRELRPQGDPEKVRIHDFVIPELGRANPYGIYDIAHNTGWVSVGVDHDTAAFAVGLAVEVLAVDDEEAFLDARVVLQERRGLEGGERLAAAGGVPDVAVAAVLIDAVDDGLDGVDLVRPHHQELLLAGDEDHVAADHLAERALGEERYRRSRRGG